MISQRNLFNLFCLKEIFPGCPFDIFGIILFLMQKSVRVIAGYYVIITIKGDQIHVGGKYNGKIDFSDVRKIFCGKYDRQLSVVKTDNSAFEIDQIGDEFIYKKINLNERVEMIGYGANHKLILTTNGNVYSVGSNYQGQLGLGKKIKMTKHHTKIIFPQKISQVSCGRNHSVALASNGKVYVWGDLTIRSGLFKKKFYKPFDIGLSEIQSVSCGSNYLIMLANGFCYVIGENEFGQLGLGDAKARKKPKKLVIPNVKIISVSCGFGHTIALTSEGKLYGWGYCSLGQLGIGKYDRDILFPKEIKLSFRIESIACGHCYTAVVTKHDNAVWVWGTSWENIFAESTLYLPEILRLT